MDKYIFYILEPKYTTNKHLTFIQNRWYVHLSRTGDNADLGVIKKTIQKLRADCAADNINLIIGFGPSLLKDLTSDIPKDFQNYPSPGYESKDGSGKMAKGTQEELLIWINHDHKDKIWKAQYDARILLQNHMKVARETPTFIYGNSLDLTGSISIS